jgi:toxin ParE1/3/4
MPHKLLLSKPALSDIENILEWTTGAFGTVGRQRYEALIQTALTDLAANPERLGTRQRDDIAPAIITYHLSASRKRSNSKTSSTQVAKPRHLILFRVNNKPAESGDSAEVQILRFLHDSMDFVQHVPTDV